MSDTLVALEGLLEELPDAADRRRLGDRLSQSMEVLRGADHQIGRLTAILDLANSTGFGVGGIQRETLMDLKEGACAVGEALETASTDDDLRDAIFQYEKEFQRTLGSTERAVRQHWASLASDSFRSLIPLGELLARIGVAPDLGRRLADCGRRALAPSDVGPVADLATRARSLLAEREALQVERADTIGAGDVGAFINALAEQRATLAMVTEDVRAWLKKNDALDRFSLAPRS